MENILLTKTNYYHRDLSWLLFNRRVINEAKDATNPLLERCRFLAIASSNLDEFFMIRVPGIQSLARLTEKRIDSKTQFTQSEILTKLFDINSENTAIQYSYYDQLKTELADNGYPIKHYDELTGSEKQYADDYFQQMLLPALTPIGLDAYHAFPRIMEKAIHVFVHVRKGDREEKAILPLPPLFDRFLKLENTTSYILLEELLAQHLAKVFVGYPIEHYFFFRITYDKDLEFEEDTEENLYIQMEEYIAERTKGLPSRLEIAGDWSTLIEEDVRFLSRMLTLKDRDIYWIPGPLDLTFLFSFVKNLGQSHPKWLYKPFRAVAPAKLLGSALYQTIDHQDVVLQHPYDSYESVLSFLEQAANDPETIAIKQTLYRMADNSRVIAALKKAARNGKQVTVLVELKARFDEENNLYWVQELEEAGCYVSYGLHQLKTHSKVILVIKKHGDQLQRYVHIGTGNYNENTAKLYTDISFFTAKKAYIEDVTAFFNYLSGYRSLPDYQRLAVSPEGIRSLLLQKIDDMIQYYKTTHAGTIFFKMNSLTDQVIIDKLYEASQAGVPIQLLVRGACCLRSGVKGLSDSIEVRSIVGRFLEHSRIYAFNFPESPQIWISSADAMTRNMLLRVEVASPMISAEAIEEVKQMTEILLADEAKTYFLQPDGQYKRKKEHNEFSAQNAFLKQAYKTQRTQETQPKDSLITRLKRIWKKDAKKNSR